MYVITSFLKPNCKVHWLEVTLSCKDQVQQFGCIYPTLNPRVFLRFSYSKKISCISWVQPLSRAQTDSSSVYYNPTGTFSCSLSWKIMNFPINQPLSCFKFALVMTTDYTTVHRPNGTLTFHACKPTAKRQLSEYNLQYQ